MRAYGALPEPRSRQSQRKIIYQTFAPTCLRSSTTMFTTLVCSSRTKCLVEVARGARMWRCTSLLEYSSSCSSSDDSSNSAPTAESKFLIARSINFYQNRGSKGSTLSQVHGRMLAGHQRCEHALNHERTFPLLNYRRCCSPRVWS